MIKTKKQAVRAFRQHSREIKYTTPKERYKHWQLWLLDSERSGAIPVGKSKAWGMIDPWARPSDRTTVSPRTNPATSKEEHA